MIVGVGAAIESDVRTVIARTAHRRIIVAQVSAAHVVISGVDESVLHSIERSAQIRIEEVPTRMRHERLRHESSSFVNAEFRIEPGQFVVLIYEASIRPEKSDKRIFCAKVMLQAQDSD